MGDSPFSTCDTAAKRGSAMKRERITNIETANMIFLLSGRKKPLKLIIKISLLSLK